MQSVSRKSGLKQLEFDPDLGLRRVPICKFTINIFHYKKLPNLGSF